jgi:hypothetical protein
MNNQYFTVTPDADAIISLSACPFFVPLAKCRYAQ